MIKGRIFDIKRFAVHDGPGIRTTVFFKGCPLKCKWCHNPESLNIRDDKIETRHQIGNKTFSNINIIGKDIGVNELLNEIEKDRIFYEESGGGVTLSGGEPMMQLEFLLAIADNCQQKGVSVCLDTCGFADIRSFQIIDQFIDLYLYDIKIMDNQKHLKYTGVSNQKILENLKYLAKNPKKIIIRYPLIPGINDDAENISTLADLMQRHNLKEINILPYHSTAEEKYKQLNCENRWLSFGKVEENKIQEIKQYFKTKNFRLKIGG